MTTADTCGRPHADRDGDADGDEAIARNVTPTTSRIPAETPLVKVTVTVAVAVAAVEHALSVI
jgi:hypothetical protein